MAITHSAATRTALADTTVDRIDLGTTNAAGQVVIQTSGAGEVATLPMSNPAFGAASGPTATANAITDDTSATGGTAAQFQVQNRDAGEVFSGSATLSGGGGDMILTSLTIGAGDTVSITSMTYTAPV